MGEDIRLFKREWALAGTGDRGQTEVVENIGGGGAAGKQYGMESACLPEANRASRERRRAAVSLG